MSSAVYGRGGPSTAKAVSSPAPSSSSTLPVNPPPLALLGKVTHREADAQQKLGGEGELGRVRMQSIHTLLGCDCHLGNVFYDEFLFVQTFINAGMESTAGVVYEGEFKDGLMEGEGELRCDADGNSEYAGKDGGALQGFKYKGHMVLGHASGIGSLEFASLVYQGGFLDGRPHGQGTLSSVASLPGKKGGGAAIHRPVASLSFRECSPPIFARWLKTRVGLVHVDPTIHTD